MAEGNYLTIPSTFIFQATEDHSSDEDAEVLGFVVVEHHYCSEVAMETDTFNPFERSNCNVEREALFKRKNDTEFKVISQQNEQRELERLSALKEKVEQETLNSLGKSLRMLHESEEVASSTAQELLRQREQLERTERRLDEVDGTLRENKKVIRNLQGVLGGVKNYIAKKCRSRTPSPNKRSDNGSESSGLKTCIVSLNKSVSKEAAYSEYSTKSHTGMKIRGLQPGPWDATDCATKASTVDEVLEKRLGDISSSIRRLQDFAVNLNTELCSENELIDRLIVKADGANTKVVEQTKEVRNIRKEIK